MAQRFRILNGDSLELLNKLEANSIDSCVCDPPYELGFMGKKWDSTGIANNVELWKSVLRVLKPGAHLVAFGGTRTYHRMACAIEDAGFEIRDQIGWLYGSGFPKSLDVSKAIDKANGAEREIVGKHPNPATPRLGTFNCSFGEANLTTPATESAKKWNGWGTALKPAWEPIVLARKPLIGTVAENVQLHGTGAINVDACRVEGATTTNPLVRNTSGFCGGLDQGKILNGRVVKTNGRWPANVIHDGSEEVLAEFAKFGERPSGAHNGTRNSAPFKGFEGGWGRICAPTKSSTGTAARFFYCAKASKRDRDEGLNGFEATFAPTMGNGIGGKEHDPETATPKRNNHPTVKPTELMRYLCKLITPPGGLILDPFTGSGSTGKAAMLEGFRFVGIELSPEYVKIARARLTKADKIISAKPL